MFDQTVHDDLAFPDTHTRRRPLTNPHGHIVTMRRRVDAHVTSLRCIDVNTTSFTRRVPARIDQVSLATRLCCI